MGLEHLLRDGRSRAAFREALARKYPTVDEARAFVDKVGLNPIRISFSSRADLTWFSILEEASKQGERWVRAILDLALEEYPDDDGLLCLRSGSAPRYAEGPDIASLGWRGRGGQSYEKLIGKQSSLVPVSFLEVGMARARAVARVKCDDGTLGTGFLVTGDLLVTNHHVLGSREAAAATTVQFNYQKTADGRDGQVEELRLEPEALFLTSMKDDYTIVKVSGEPSARWGVIELQASRIHAEDRVNVIQHPGGEQKQLSFFHNLVVFVGEGRVQYLTDTLPGSSGSPVFDKDWKLVALHHSGGWLVEPGSRERFYRNEGILVDRLIDALQAGNPSLPA
ncbi:trypsin-like peptidase domain-containing protein [Sorangium sp. KYC3313]|uniref:trypsin-like peptidase domain-containing protein n=1 Tax=Sorangium sp. KYC3313 TaxID=3449740 RepID=UPI003F88F758